MEKKKYQDRLISFEEYREEVQVKVHLKALKDMAYNLEINPREKGVVVGMDKYKLSDVEFIISHFKKEELEYVGCPPYLYMLEIYSKGKIIPYVKIGVSGDVKKRVSQLNTAWRKVGIKYKIKLVSRKLYSAYPIEKSIHYTLEINGYKYTPKNSLDGANEIFRYESWMDNLIPIDSTHSESS